jgi:hypothetical protein
MPCGLGGRFPRLYILPQAACIWASNSPSQKPFPTSCMNSATYYQSRLLGCSLTIRGSATGAKGDTSRNRPSTAVIQLHLRKLPPTYMDHLSRHGSDQDTNLQKLQGEPAKVSHPISLPPSLPPSLHPSAPLNSSMLSASLHNTCMLTLPQGCAMSSLRRKRMGRASRLEKEAQGLAASRTSRKESSDHARPTSAQLWRLVRQRRIQLTRLARRRRQISHQAVRQKLDLSGRLLVRLDLCSVICHDYIHFLFILPYAVYYTHHTHRQQLTALPLAAAFLAFHV